MNVARYLRVKDGKLEVRRMRFSASDGVSRTDAAMASDGWTRRLSKHGRRKLAHLRPHQQPGYKQPSEQQRRRARQLLRGERQ